MSERNTHAFVEKAVRPKHGGRAKTKGDAKISKTTIRNSLRTLIFFSGLLHSYSMQTELSGPGRYCGHTPGGFEQLPLSENTKRSGRKCLGDELRWSNDVQQIPHCKDQVETAGLDEQRRRLELFRIEVDPPARKISEFAEMSFIVDNIFVSSMYCIGLPVIRRAAPARVSQLGPIRSTQIEFRKQDIILHGAATCFLLIPETLHNDDSRRPGACVAAATGVS